MWGYWTIVSYVFCSLHYSSKTAFIGQLFFAGIPPTNKGTLVGLCLDMLAGVVPHKGSVFLANFLDLPAGAIPLAGAVLRRERVFVAFLLTSGQGLFPIE